MLRLVFLTLFGAVALLCLCEWVLPAPSSGAEARCGLEASWYGTESGTRTATGEFFDGTSLTAAMPSRRHFGERWRVTYAGRSVVVRINDLGPAAWTGRAIDLSRAAASAIGLIRSGHGQVCLERLPAAGLIGR